MTLLSLNLSLGWDLDPKCSALRWPGLLLKYSPCCKQQPRQFAKPSCPHCQHERTLTHSSANLVYGCRVVRDQEGNVRHRSRWVTNPFATKRLLRVDIHRQANIRIVHHGFFFPPLFWLLNGKEKPRIVSYYGGTISLNFISSVPQNDFHTAQQLTHKDKQHYFIISVTHLTSVHV